MTASALAPGTAVPAVASSSPPRVLYLTHRVPYPPDKGDRIRNYHVLRQLAARGRVWLGCLADEPVTAETRDELGRLAERVTIVPVGRRSRWLKAFGSLATGRSISEGLFSSVTLRRVVRAWAAEVRFDAAVVSASSLAPYLTGLAAAGVPAVVDLVDVDSQKWLDFADAARGPRRWLYRHEAGRVRAVERGLTRWATAVTVVSRAEATVYEGFAGPGTATVATNGVDLDYFRPVDISPKQACVFVGAFDYRPNVDGAVWFAREVWPGIRRRWPEAEFRLVGRTPSAEVRRLAEVPGVVVVGGVPDVRPHVAAAEVVVAPLRLARGVQNKVLEAMAMGRPVVAAPPALNGIAAAVGREVLTATTPAEWAAVVGGLFADPARRQEVGDAGRRFVEARHHWDRCLAPLVDAVFYKPV